MKAGLGKLGSRFALWFLPGVLVGAIGFGLLSHRPSNPSHSPSNPGIGIADERAKPWGALEEFQFPFGDPEALSPDRDARLRSAEWYFENITQSELESLLNSCGLTEKQKADLLRNSKWQASTNGFLVSPSDELVQTLTPAARGKIYSVLARSSANYSQRFPFRFAPESFSARFAFTELSPSTLALIGSLCYTNSGDLCFADLQLLPGLLKPDELDEALNALYRVPTYLLRLRIFEDSDVEKLAAYWAKGGRTRRIKPLLDSLKKAAGTNGTALNVSYLLPSFARLRLYTFPKVWPDINVAQEDCFWTSMNFFNAQPDNRFLDATVAMQALQSDCTPVSAPMELGDLIALLDGTGKGIHLCVFIADDFVFTKNGKNVLSPWVIMKMADMLSLFPADHRRVLTFRPKTAAVPAAKLAR